MIGLRPDDTQDDCVQTGFLRGAHAGAAKTIGDGCVGQIGDPRKVRLDRAQQRDLSCRLAVVKGRDASHVR
jgi:hypothetical protein